MLWPQTATILHPEPDALEHAAEITRACQNWGFVWEGPQSREPEWTSCRYASMLLSAATCRPLPLLKLSIPAKIYDHEHLKHRAFQSEKQHSTINLVM